MLYDNNLNEIIIESALIFKKIEFVDSQQILLYDLDSVGQLVCELVRQISRWDSQGLGLHGLGPWGPKGFAPPHFSEFALIYQLVSIRKTPY